MQLSRLVAVLQKVNQIAGDIPVVLHTAETVAESELAALHISLPLDGTTPAVAAIGPHTPAPEASQEGASPPQNPPAA